MRKRQEASRAAAVLILIVLAAPVFPALAAPTPFSPPGAACPTTLEDRLDQARPWPYTEDPDAGTWSPWLVEPATLDVPPPPGAASARHAEEWAELRLLAAQRTEADVAAARHWDEGPASRAWERILVDTIAQGSSVMEPPPVSRQIAVFEVALHDALVAAWRVKYCHQRAPPGALDPTLPALELRHVPSYPSEHAVVAGAASVVLDHFYAGVVATDFGALAREAAESRLVAGLNWRSDVEAGLALGRAVAERVLEARADDGSAGAGAPVPLPSGPCAWTPTDAAFPDPLMPGWGRVQPWLLPRGDALRPPPPPPCGGAEWLDETHTLHETSSTLTPAQIAAALDHEQGAGTPLPPGVNLERALDASLRHGLTTMRHARLMAAAGAAVADAAIAAWDAKYAYWTERPITTIRAGWDADWTPLLRTPDFPGYVSGHATFSASVAELLSATFPDEAAQHRAWAQEDADSRFWGGVHIQPDNARGAEIGRAIGALAAQRAQPG